MIGDTYVCIESYSVTAVTEDNKLAAFRIDKGDKFVCTHYSDTVGAANLVNDDKQISVRVPLSRLQYHFKLASARQDAVMTQPKSTSRSLSDLNELKCKVALNLYKEIPEDISRTDYTLLLSMLITELSTSLAKAAAVDKD